MFPAASSTSSSIRGPPVSIYLLATLTASLVFLLGACGSSKTSLSPTSTAASEVSTPRATATEPSIAPSPTPLSLARVSDEPVGFGTADGAILRGHVYSVPGPKRRIVIFASADTSAWRAQASGFVAPGIDILMFDFRGQGETRGPGDDGKLDLDLEAAVRFMKSRDYALVYVVGADAGGTAAIKVAARQDLAGIVVVSAPITVQGGIDARADIVRVQEPKLFIAARGDADTVGAVNFFMLNAPEPKQSQLLDGGMQGSALLFAAASQLIHDFVTK